METEEDPHYGNLNFYEVSNPISPNRESIYEHFEVRARPSRFSVHANAVEPTSPNREEPSESVCVEDKASKETPSHWKTGMLIVSVILAILSTSVMVAMIVKVDNNLNQFKEAQQIQEQNILTLTKDFNDTAEKLWSKMQVMEENSNNSFEKIYDQQKDLDLKLNKSITALEIDLKKQKLLLNTLEMNMSGVEKYLNESITTFHEIKSCEHTCACGVFKLPSGEEVYCSDGWRICQRRMDGSLPDFHEKSWEEYAGGFGNLTGEFWLGLRKLHALTQNGACKLRVDLENWNNVKAYAEYRVFSVDSENNLFNLTVGSYSGTAEDSLTPNSQSYNINHMAFSTIDRDNDMSSINCAKDGVVGGWWSNNCGFAFPNAEYGERALGSGIVWYTFSSVKLKFIQMGVRCY